MELLKVCADYWIAAKRKECKSFKFTAYRCGRANYANLSQKHLKIMMSEWHSSYFRTCTMISTINWSIWHALTRDAFIVIIVYNVLIASRMVYGSRSANQMCLVSRSCQDLSTTPWERGAHRPISAHWSHGHQSFISLNSLCYCLLLPLATWRAKNDSRSRQNFSHGGPARVRHATHSWN